jgi:hypothetical protein
MGFGLSLKKPPGGAAGAEAGRVVVVKGALLKVFHAGALLTIGALFTTGAE